MSLKKTSKSKVIAVAEVKVESEELNQVQNTIKKLSFKEKPTKK